MENKESNKLLWAIAAVVVVLGMGAAVYALTMSNNTKQATPSSKKAETSTEKKPASESNASESTATTVITFTNDGFNPTDYTSKVGEAVTVKNNSSMDLQFSSDNHPAHTDNPEINLGNLAPGESASFTPDGAGTYGFHDHLNDELTGTLVVK